jgi:hypothetical protein
MWTSSTVCENEPLNHNVYVRFFDNLRTVFNDCDCAPYTPLNTQKAFHYINDIYEMKLNDSFIHIAHI